MSLEINKIDKIKYNDIFGPEYMVKIYDPKIGMEGYLVIDNTAFGPGKGGVRMTSDVTEEEIFRLARAMTYKNVLADIPFGGAKAGIKFPNISNETSSQKFERKKAYIQSFARAIKPFTPKKYIAGPDVNTGEREMQWFVEATGIWKSATGKPTNLCIKVNSKNNSHRCGIPHEFGSTGFGVAEVAKIAAEVFGLNINGATVAIHGFGNVGTFTYKFLTEMGAKVVSVADVSGAIYAENGFDGKTMEKMISDMKLISEYAEINPRGKEGKKIKIEEFWKLSVDILIPASVTDVINESNKNDIRAKIIVEAGNIPMRENIENELFKKNIMIVPDFVANSGGVISSYAEYRGLHPRKMFELITKKIGKTARIILNESLNKKINPRELALMIAKKKIEKKINFKTKNESFLVCN